MANQDEDSEPKAAFSLSHALDMVRKRQRLDEQAKEEAEKIKIEERKEREREKRRRRRKNQKDRKQQQQLQEQQQQSSEKGQDRPEEAAPVEALKPLKLIPRALLVKRKKE